MNFQKTTLYVLLGTMVVAVGLLIWMTRQSNLALQGAKSEATSYSKVISSARSVIAKTQQPSKELASSQATDDKTQTADFSNDQKLVQNFFKSMLTYNTSTYLKRADKAKAYASDQPIQLILGTGGGQEQPPTTIDSKLLAVGFFPDYQAAKQLLAGESYAAIVTVQFHFQYQGQDSDTNATYKVNIDPSSHKITDMWVRNEQGDYR